MRFAAYHNMRTARMMGSSAMRVGAISAGSDAWFAGEMRTDLQFERQKP